MSSKLHFGTTVVCLLYRGMTIEHEIYTRKNRDSFHLDRPRYPYYWLDSVKYNLHYNNIYKINYFFDRNFSCTIMKMLKTSLEIKKKKKY